jgi:hypothetical protein
MAAKEISVKKYVVRLSGEEQSAIRQSSASQLEGARSSGSSV